MTQHDQTTYSQPLQPPLLPLTGRVAIYAREAPRALKTSQPQSNDLFALVLQMGYSTEQVTIFEESQASGKAASLRRSALSKLLAQITQPPPDTEPIKAIVVSSENRLFRDAPSAAIAVFIQTCIEHGILLVTPTMTYNFSTPAHAAQFRLRCETASQYVQQVIASRLQAGKKHKREQKTQKDGQ
jgi:DNA invertase Pin-like site-specific DNA recombinase